MKPRVAGRLTFQFYFRGNHTCPEPNNAWWGSEIDILEARKFDDFASLNIHYGGYKGQNGNEMTGCYNNSHTDEPTPGRKSKIF